MMLSFLGTCKIPEIGENPAVPARPPAPRTKATRKANLAEVEARYRGCVILVAILVLCVRPDQEDGACRSYMPNAKNRVSSSFFFVCLFVAGGSQPTAASEATLARIKL